MTKDEIKAIVAAKIAGQGTNVDGGGALSDVLNAILDAIPESGVMPEPKYEIPTTLSSTIDAGQFAESLGISVDEIPDFFRAQVIKQGYLNLTRTYYGHFTENEEEYYAIFGDVAPDYGIRIAFHYNVPGHNIIVDIAEA